MKRYPMDDSIVVRIAFEEHKIPNTNRKYCCVVIIGFHEHEKSHVKRSPQKKKDHSDELSGKNQQPSFRRKNGKMKRMDVLRDVLRMFAGHLNAVDR